MKIGQNGIKMEYPFFTMTTYPNGFILHIGATVSARSVKLLERIPNLDQPELRDLWWTEIRMEIRSHARTLGCNVVLGYSELTTISYVFELNQYICYFNCLIYLIDNIR